MTTLPSSLLRIDFSDLGRLDDEHRAEVVELIKVMQKVDGSLRKTRTLRAEAGRLRTSYSRLRRLYYGEKTKRDGVSVHRDGWTKIGWRALVNQSKATPAARELPISLVDYWKELRLKHQREQTGKSAYDELMEQLRKWRRDPNDEALRIPGYSRPPKNDPFTGVPRGWSYPNLMKYEVPELLKDAMRQGRNAALAFRAPMISTRVGLKVGAILQFDDQKYDNFINFLGINRSLQCALGLDCIDVASASQPTHGFLPVTVDPENGKRIQLKAFHAEWFLAHTLMEFGYRALSDGGTRCVIEHGTMTVSEAFEERAALATGDAVTFLRSGIIDNKAHAAMFDGKGGGNFKFKALLEGARVAHRNRASALPAPTGLNPDEAPEEAYYGLKKVNDRVLRLMEKLSPERAAILAHVAADFHSFIGAALEIYDLLEDTADHELEGWHGQGWVKTKWRHSLDTEEWHDMEEIEAIAEPVIREAMRALVTTRPGLLNTVRLSRRAARLSQEHELVKLRGAAVPVLLGRDCARVGTVEKHHPLIKVHDQEFFPDPIFFHAQLRQSRETLQRGGEFLLYVDPFGCHRAEVCDLKGRWLGTVEYWDRPNPLDEAARGKQYGMANAAFQDELSRLGLPRYSLPAIEARTRIFEHNAAVARGEAITSEEKAAEREEREDERAIERRQKAVRERGDIPSIL